MRIIFVFRRRTVGQKRILVESSDTDASDDMATGGEDTVDHISDNDDSETPLG
jgi:hypothetical protein